jgi:hypothetical protein
LIPYTGRLAIFTSFYSHYAYAPYVISLAQSLGVLSALGVKWDYLARPSDFHIERAINNTLTEVMEHGGFTDVLLIDSDESWEPEGLVRLLLHPEEVVAGTYPMKNAWDRYVGSVKQRDGTPLGKILKDGTALLEADRVAAGFLRIKVSALRKWADAYPELRSKEPDGEKVQFFSRGLIDGEMACQDMMFSKRWLDIGGQLWIDPMVKIGHWGMECHQGDYDKHLRGKVKAAEASAKLADAAPAIAMVKQMAAALR